MVLDVANPNNNLTDNINDLSIGEYRKLKKYYLNLLIIKITYQIIVMQQLF